MYVAKLGCLSWVILWHDAVSSGIIALHAIQLQRSHDVVCAQQTSERFFPREATHSNIDYLALSRVSFSWTGGGLCICLSNFGKFTPAQYVSTWDRPLVESCSKRNLTYFVCIWCIYIQIRTFSCTHAILKAVAFIASVQFHYQCVPCLSIAVGDGDMY